MITQRPELADKHATTLTAAEEILNIQSARGLVDLTRWGVLRISGDDSKRFLQGQLTCDLNAVTAEQSQLGAHCNPQGRILSLFRLFYFQDVYYLAMPYALIPLAHQHLKKYAVFYKTALTPDDDSLINIGCFGEDLQVFFAALPTHPGAVVTYPDYLIYREQGSFPRYSIWGKRHVVHALWQYLQQHLPVYSENIWQVFALRNKIPNIYPETSGKFLPHDLNLLALHGVSLDKGCFTGQEIIARMHYRGKPKNFLYRARIKTTSPPLIGSDIYTKDKQAHGIIVDSCHTSYNYYEVLLVTDETHARHGELMLTPDKEEFFEFLDTL